MTQEKKAQRFERWSKAINMVCQALRDMGLDPERVSYEEAIKKAEAFHQRNESIPSETAKRPLR